MFDFRLFWKCLMLPILAAAMFGLTLWLPGTAFAGIVGSDHDFADKGWNTTGEVCAVCHVPHDNKGHEYWRNGLLWNHKLSVATYTMYDSNHSDSIDGAVSAQPDGTAKLCLGCHDGTVAIDEFGASPTQTKFLDGGEKIPSFMDGANLDMRGTHPISIVYDEAADGNLSVQTTAMGASGTIADVLDDGKVQCSSCHDVHDQETLDGSLLREQLDGSVLCLVCHTK